MLALAALSPILAVATGLLDPLKDYTRGCT
jgi:hypothetical protein